jgi:predicted  nucleic acid-binding Zn-ribbon protein
MEQLSQSMKRKWKELLKRQQATLVEATQQTQDLVDVKQHIAQQQQDLLALKARIEQEVALFGQDRSQLKNQWLALAGGIAQLGRKLSGEPDESIATTAAPLAEVDLGDGERVVSAITSFEDQSEVAELREHLAVARERWQKQQQSTEQLQATMSQELEQFAKERDTAKQQWLQMSTALHKLGLHYRDQVKKLKEQRQGIAQEHDKIMSEKNAILEQFTQQTTHVAALQQELEQLKAALHDQVQSLSD